MSVAEPRAEILIDHHHHRAMARTILPMRFAVGGAVASLVIDALDGTLMLRTLALAVYLPGVLAATRVVMVRTNDRAAPLPTPSTIVVGPDALEIIEPHQRYRQDWASQGSWDEAGGFLIMKSAGLRRMIPTNEIDARTAAAIRDRLAAAGVQRRRAASWTPEITGGAMVALALLTAL